MNGDLLIKLYEDTSDWLTVDKCAVSPSGDKIFVPTFNPNMVCILARDGTVLHTVTDLEIPWGIHVTDLEKVLVCGGNSTLSFSWIMKARRRRQLLLLGGIDLLTHSQSSSEGAQHP
ncbi:uncharacterized protein LOC127863629 [Dreissena polymorpha]|uniref:Uncharacterized protein n=1 Tax=Dreissena polymorpha TaxID=45954 RepID=A0A9D4B6S6_DREPO|nr:uncharacterized protein LOC127863629 [Dreissena polymorpha]KAH3691377.1 hypothetical protein DPMN_194011 [Dreissena polymorpha]